MDKKRNKGKDNTGTTEERRQKVREVQRQSEIITTRNGSETEL